MPRILRERCGHIETGEEIEAVTLDNGCGVTATVLSFGATLQRLVVPDREGCNADVVLGHDDWRDYARHRGFLGVTVGRFANRIAGASFELDGQRYRLDANDRGVNTLHGGERGLDQRAWSVAEVCDGDAPAVRLTCTSPDGEGGFPATLEVVATYVLDTQNCLTITYEAECDAPTIVSLTNHAVLNLAGEGAPQGACEHRLMIAASRYTPINKNNVPTGKLVEVDGTPFDFRVPRALSKSMRAGSCEQIRLGRGYDHNFALDKALTSEPEFAARLSDTLSGRELEVYTTEPGLQLYSGNFLDGTLVGKRGHLYRMGDGIALEPQKFPNAPNEPRFATARLDPGELYRHVSQFRFRCT